MNDEFLCSSTEPSKHVQGGQYHINDVGRYVAYEIECSIDETGLVSASVAPPVAAGEEPNQQIHAAAKSIQDTAVLLVEGGGRGEEDEELGRKHT